jgi:hypothetical protein
MNVGLRVRLKGIPDGLPNPPDLPTKLVFQQCIGHEFAVAGVNEVGMAELNVESVTQNLAETIWVEPKFLEVIS